MRLLSTAAFSLPLHPTNRPRIDSGVSGGAFRGPVDHGPQNGGKGPGGEDRLPCDFRNGGRPDVITDEPKVWSGAIGAGMPNERCRRSGRRGPQSVVDRPISAWARNRLLGESGQASRIGQSDALQGGGRMSTGKCRVILVAVDTHAPTLPSAFPTTPIRRAAREHLS